MALKPRMNSPTKTSQSFTKGSEFAYCWALWNMLPSQIRFFSRYYLFEILPLRWRFPFICHMGFRPQVVLALIYTFTINIMLTELAKQHITWIIEVIWKLLITVFQVKGLAVFFSRIFAGDSGGHCVLLALFGRGAGVIVKFLVDSVIIGQFCGSVIAEIIGPSSWH